jgi:iron complex transport system ATP-binding protein
MLQGRVRAEGAPADVLRPEVLSPAYGTQVDVVPDPATGQPLVAPRIAR